MKKQAKVMVGVDLQKRIRAAEVKSYTSKLAASTLQGAAPVLADLLRVTGAQQGAGPEEVEKWATLAGQMLLGMAAKFRQNAAKDDGAVLALKEVAAEAKG